MEVQQTKESKMREGTTSAVSPPSSMFEPNLTPYKMFFPTTATSTNKTKYEEMVERSRKPRSKSQVAQIMEDKPVPVRRGRSQSVKDKDNGGQTATENPCVETVTSPGNVLTDRVGASAGRRGRKRKTDLENVSPTDSCISILADSNRRVTRSSLKKINASSSVVTSSADANIELPTPKRPSVKKQKNVASASTDTNTIELSPPKKTPEVIMLPPNSELLLAYDVKVEVLDPEVDFLTPVMKKGRKSVPRVTKCNPLQLHTPTVGGDASKQAKSRRSKSKISSPTTTFQLEPLADKPIVESPKPLDENFSNPGQSDKNFNVQLNPQGAIDFQSVDFQSIHGETEVSSNQPLSSEDSVVVPDPISKQQASFSTCSVIDIRESSLEVERVNNPNSETEKKVSFAAIIARKLTALQQNTNQKNSLMTSFPDQPPPSPATPIQKSSSEGQPNKEAEATPNFDVNDPLVHVASSQENVEVTYQDLEGILDENVGYCNKIFHGGNPWTQYILMDNERVAERCQVVDAETLKNDADLDSFLETMKLTPVLDPEEIKAVLGIDLNTPLDSGDFQCSQCSTQFTSYEECLQHMQTGNCTTEINLSSIFG